MNVNIREYHESDYFSLFVILKEAYDTNISQIVLENQYITPSRFILVATDEKDSVVGCSFIEIQEDYVRPSKIAFVTYVAVKESLRKQGVGRKIFLAIEEICKSKGCSAIELTSADFRIGAHAFYESIGYSKKKTTVFIKEM